MSEEEQEKIRFKPFDPDIHDRAAFSCGVERIDNFVKRTAKKHQKGDFTRVWVAVGDEPAAILGFYAINAHAIAAADLPAKYTRHAPAHGYVPAAYISMFGVSERRQGHGFGRVLLADCLKRIAEAADSLGIYAIVLDVFEDADVERRKAFYEAHGFQSFPSQPLRMFLPVQTVRQLLRARDATQV